MLDEITTAPGSASACSRAARFGVSPTTSCSWAAPTPMRSPTTTSPVAMPTRTCKGTPAAVLSFGTASTSESPARTARSASCSMGLGIAEIGQYPVAHVPGDETAGSGDEIGAAAVVRADDLAHVLGVEPGRERGRANEVAEHDRELTALGGVQQARRGGRRCGCGDLTGALFSMASRSAIARNSLRRWPSKTPKLLQILIRQIGEDAEIDPVLAKRLRVLLQTDPAEPTIDVQDHPCACSKLDLVGQVDYLLPPYP